MAENTYTLTIAPDNSSYSLTINGKTVIKDQTKLTNKPTLTDLFSNNGYGEPRVVNGVTIYCPCSGLDEGSAVYVELVKAKFKPA